MNIYSLDFLCSCQFKKPLYKTTSYLFKRKECRGIEPPTGWVKYSLRANHPADPPRCDKYMFVVAKLCAAYCRLLNENWSRKYEHCALNKNFAKFVSENIPRSELSNPQYIGGCLVYTVHIYNGGCMGWVRVLLFMTIGWIPNPHPITPTLSSYVFPLHPVKNFIKIICIFSKLFGKSAHVK